jgi:Family of unknown function (DUF5719)
VVKRASSGRLLLAAIVVVVLAGLYALAGLHHPAAAADNATPATRAAVTSTVRACAAPGTTGVTSGSLAIAAMPDSGSAGSGSAGSGSAGSAVAARLVPGGGPAVGQVLSTATQPGLLHLTAVRSAPALAKSLQAGQPGSSPKVSTVAGRGGVVVTATGAMAQGLAVAQTDADGTVTAECNSPGTSFWFLAPGQTNGGNIELYLMNTDSVPADAQVTAVTDITKGGPILGDADNGIDVPPHSMVVQSLTGLLQSSKVVALNVSTSVGQVVAAVRESRSSADAGSWIPVSQPPSRRLVIPGLPNVSGTPDLYVAVPGGGTAQVKVTVVTPRGSYQPTGGTNIPLLGGTATQISMPALAGVTGSVIITSSAPVVAAMLVPGGPAGTPGVLAASAAPVQEQGVLADSRSGSSDIILSAPAGAATVRVAVGTSTVPVTGQSGTLVQVRAGASVVVPVKAPAGHHSGALMVVVTPQPGSGPVYAGWTISAAGSVRSVLPVPSCVTWVPLPAVRAASGVAP